MQATKQVLVAHNSAPVRMQLRARLEQAGFAVVEAATAAEAVVIAAQEQPDAILLDLMLPVDGIGTIRIILANSPHANVVALSASDDLDEFVRALGAGAIGYLVEEPDDHRLTAAVDAAVHGETALPLRLISPLIADYLGDRPPL